MSDDDKTIETPPIPSVPKKVTTDQRIDYALYAEAKSYQEKWQELKLWLEDWSKMYPPDTFIGSDGKVDAGVMASRSVVDRVIEKMIELELR